MNFASTALLFAFAALAVAVIGVALAWSADSIGRRFRIESSITGFVLLAAATSLPELVVACQVARAGAVDMAAGSLLGSCLMNLLIYFLILHSDLLHQPAYLAISLRIH